MDRFSFKSFLWLGLLFCCLDTLSAQPEFYYYKQLGIKEGLSQSRVQCMLNDHKGYLWIGTEAGLNR